MLSEKGDLVKNTKKLSILIVLAILLGLVGTTTATQAEATQSSTRMTVLELRSSAG